MLISPNLKLLMDANLGVVTVWRIQAESLHCPLAPPASSLSNELWGEHVGEERVRPNPLGFVPMRFL